MSNVLVVQMVAQVGEIIATSIHEVVFPFRAMPFQVEIKRHLGGMLSDPSTWEVLAMDCFETRQEAHDALFTFADYLYCTIEAFNGILIPKDDMDYAIYTGGIGIEERKGVI